MGLDLSNFTVLPEIALAEVPGEDAPFEGRHRLLA